MTPSPPTMADQSAEAVEHRIAEIERRFLNDVVDTHDYSFGAARVEIDWLVSELRAALARTKAAETNALQMSATLTLQARHRSAAEARCAEMVGALEKIADEQKVYKGHGDYDIEPALTAVEAQTVARDALTKEPTP